MKKNHLSRKQVIAIFAVAVGLIALWVFRLPLSHFMIWINDREAVSNTVQEIGIWGPMLLFVLLVLQVFVAVIPGHTLILTGGYVYGFVASMLITLVSTVLGSQIAFLIARRFGRSAVYKLAKPEVIRKWDNLAANQGILFYFFTFVLPIFPSDLMCYVAGLGKISPRRFLVANILGRFVCASFITLIGSNGLQMPVAFWALTIVVVVGIYVAWLIYSRRNARASTMILVTQE